jgi:hypothetical protein
MVFSSSTFPGSPIKTFKWSVSRRFLYKLWILHMHVFMQVFVYFYLLFTWRSKFSKIFKILTFIFWTSDVSWFDVANSEEKCRAWCTFFGQEASWTKILLEGEDWILIPRLELTWHIPTLSLIWPTKRKRLCPFIQ